MSGAPGWQDDAFLSFGSDGYLFQVRRAFGRGVCLTVQEEAGPFVLEGIFAFA
jgi:hypothetical protein